jgi:hypothetical protein
MGKSVKRVIRRPKLEHVQVSEFMRVAPLPEVSSLLDSHFNSRIEVLKTAPLNAQIDMGRIQKLYESERMAAETALSSPPLDRLFSLLAEWIEIYETQMSDGYDEYGFASNSLPVMRSSLTLLVMGRFEQAFGLLNSMKSEPEKYGPVPDALDFSTSFWVDLSERFRTPKP